MSREPENLGEPDAGEPENLAGPVDLATEIERVSERKALRVIGWFSMGMAVATLGIYLGFEIRSRYKFKRRTPYDFYAQAGSRSTSEFGVGI